LRRGEVLQGGDEGEFDGLALFIASLGRGIAVVDAYLLVGVGRDPHRFGDRRAEIVAG
jgi:hypothetical protein